MECRAGKTLLHYRLVGKVGEGGMGVVWIALDTKLGREVAIKFPPGGFVQDPDRLARFRREARAAAGLSHPGIVTLHAVEEVEGIPFLVMERVRGQALAEAIPPGGLPAGHFLELAVALADAMVAAHRKGIAHRDLKPGNILVDEEGRPRILDFGLARLEPLARGEDGSATRTATRAGAVLGTPAYMSPEQAQGLSSDTRSDLFSFGVLLYEMATGRLPFDAGNPALALSALLRDEPPPVSSLRTDLPGGITDLLRDCLEKNPARRPTADEVLERLKSSRDAWLRNREGEQPSTRAGRRGRSLPLRLAPAAASLLIAVVASLIVWLSLETGPAPDRFADEPLVARRLSPFTSGAGLERWPAWSPDGFRVVFCADVDGYSKLFLRDLSTGEERQLTTGPRDDIRPAWSPDGGTLAFVRAREEVGRLQPGDALSGEYLGGDVWLLDLESGRERRILEHAFNPVFSSDGAWLAVDASWAGPRRIWLTDARGRNPRQVTTDASEAVTHTHPAWSPDGARIAFQSAENTKFDIRVVDLSSGETLGLTDDGYPDLNPVWSPTGRHVYFSSFRGGSLNIWRIRVGGGGAAKRAPEQVTAGAGLDLQPAISPDGSRLLFSVLQQNADLWRLPLDPATGARAGDPEPLVATTREESRGDWSPDGRSLAFNSDPDGDMNLWVLSLGDGTSRRLTSGGGGDYQPVWSPDGRQLAFFSSRSGTTDIWVADAVTGALTQLTTGPALDVNPAWSPDGRRIAFMSDRDGRPEVWLMASDGSGARPLTTVGSSGHFLRWTADGQWVIFRSGTPGQRVIYRVHSEDGRLERLPDVDSGAHMSLSPDGRSILDVANHRELWVFPLDGSPALEVFAFEDPETRIDYPVWSPDGRWVVFDRVAPQGGDIWMMEGLE